MAIRNVLTGTKNEALRKKSREVKSVSKRIKTLLDDMKETMRVEEGVGLAAPQVGVLRRVIVIEYEEQTFEAVNPKISNEKGEAVGEEGCLSVTDVRGTVKRPESVTVVYTDRDGKAQKIEAEGMLARIFCHEIDHLNGVLFVDKMIERVE